MLTLLTVYVFGAFLNLLVIGCLTASYALSNHARLADGMMLFTVDALKQLALALVWPLTLSYMVSYWVLSKYIAYLINRELKREGAVQSFAVNEVDTEPTDDTIELDINPVDPGLN